MASTVFELVNSASAMAPVGAALRGQSGHPLLGRGERGRRGRPAADPGQFRVRPMGECGDAGRGELGGRRAEDLAGLPSAPGAAVCQTGHQLKLAEIKALLSIAQELSRIHHNGINPEYDSGN